MSRIIDWLLKSFFLLIVLHPFSVLLLYQKISLFWFLLLYNQMGVVHDYVNVKKFLLEYESDYFVTLYGNRLWFVRLFALWCIQTMVLFVVFPVVVFCCKFDFNLLYMLYVLWLLQSPVCYLLWYLLSLLDLCVVGGFCLSLLLVVPWILPSMIWLSSIIYAYQYNLIMMPYLYMLFGWMFLSVSFLPIMIDFVRSIIYSNLRSIIS